MPFSRQRSHMDYVRLGNTGLKVSRICLGTMTYGTPAWRPWVLDEAASRPFFTRALEPASTSSTPPTCIRAASAKRSSAGRLKELRQPRPGRDRHQGVLSGDRRPEHRAACRASTSSTPSTRSLRRLGTDYVDLYQIHRFDSDTPIEETLEALHDIVKAGKARYIGASSMYAWQFAKMLHVADAHGWTRFVSMQNHYNLVYREEEREMMPLCREEGIGVIPWSPLARGFLAGNRRSDDHGDTARAKTDDFAHELYYADVGLHHRRSGRRSSRGAAASSRRRWRWRGCSPSQASPRRSSARRSCRTRRGGGGARLRARRRRDARSSKSPTSRIRSSGSTRA